MKIAAKVYEKCPQGLQPAVLADVIDLGIIPTEYKGETKPVHKMFLVWLTKRTDSEGKQFRLFQKPTVSVHQNSNYAKIVESVTGELPGEDHDTESMIGTQANLVVKHKKVQGEVMVEISDLLPAEEGVEAVKIPADFKRDQDNDNKIATKHRAKKGLAALSYAASSNQSGDSREDGVPAQPEANDDESYGEDEGGLEDGTRAAIGDEDIPF